MIRSGVEGSFEQLNCRELFVATHVAGLHASSYSWNPPMADRTRVGGTLTRRRRSVVLVVDDCADLREVTAAAREDAGSRALVEANALEAVKLAVAEGPDLVLMDARMPVMDGFEATRQLRSHERTRATPVVMLTSCAGAVTEGDARAVGCTDFLTKPIEPEQLIERLRALTSSDPQHDSDVG